MAYAHLSIKRVGLVQELSRAEDNQKVLIGYWPETHDGSLGKHALDPQRSGILLCQLGDLIDIMGDEGRHFKFHLIKEESQSIWQFLYEVALQLKLELMEMAAGSDCVLLPQSQLPRVRCPWSRC